MKNDVESSAILLEKARDFSRVSSLENYEGMLGTLSEDDSKVKNFILKQKAKFKVELFRIDVDVGQNQLMMKEGGKRPVVVVPSVTGDTVQIPVPEKSTPPIDWRYKKIGERLMYDLSELMMCDIIRIGRFPFNHFFPVMQDGSLDLTVSREHGLVLFYAGGLHYVDYGSLIDTKTTRKEGSTNGTFLSNGMLINNCMYKWQAGEYLEFGKNIEVQVNHSFLMKRCFRLIYSVIE